jgi:hypothetical protein
MLQKRHGRHAEKPVKATGIYYDTHDCKSYGKCILERGWLVRLWRTKGL